MQSEPTSIVSFSKRHRDEHGGEPVIDREVFSILEELADDDDPDLVPEIIDLFLEDSAMRMAQVSEASSESDADTIRGAAHALKSSSANIGALRFSKACASLEAAAQGDDPEGLSKLVEEAMQLYGDVRAALDRSTGHSAGTGA